MGRATSVSQGDGPGAVMRFPAAPRTIAALLVGGAIVALLLAPTEGGGAGVRLMQTALSLATAAIVAAAVEVFGVAHRLTPDGIERVTPWRRRLLVRWRDVASVTWAGPALWYELRTSDGEVVRVYRQLGSMRAFARAALAGIAPEVLEAGPSVRARLEQLAAGVEPADDADREEWRGP